MTSDFAPNEISTLGLEFGSHTYELHIRKYAIFRNGCELDLKCCRQIHRKLELSANLTQRVFGKTESLTLSRVLSVKLKVLPIQSVVTESGS